MKWKESFKPNKSKIVKSMWMPAIIVAVFLVLYVTSGDLSQHTPILPCRPCFRTISYIDYVNGVFYVAVGSQQINITRCFANENPVGCTVWKSYNYSNAIGTPLAPGTHLNITGIGGAKFTSGISYILVVEYYPVAGGPAMLKNDTATLKA